MEKNSESEVDSILRRLRDLSRYTISAPAGNKRVNDAIKIIEKLRDEKQFTREAFRDYVKSEGCGCCQDRYAHEEAADKLGQLLNFKRYDDNSGWDFYEND